MTVNVKTQPLSSQPTEHHKAFKWIRNERIESLDIIIDQFEHIATGAQHYHLTADYDENVFLVALRTIPTDSTGVAHILEHTALCGSQKYPVRDPFFMMIRRSLNTFMNAFTSSDWTAYPFASQNNKDFNNLLDVYLDAVFFSRLDELDFAQEGHRLEFEKADDSNSDLQYKGVVFNEMKGAMSSVVSALWQSMSKNLFPTSTYHFNSGGEPADIPNLSHKELKKFYHTHYHPSNAIFMTFGNIPAHIHQQKFEDQVLSKFERLNKDINVKDEQRISKPIQVEETYALSPEEDDNNKTHLVMGWLLGHSIDLQQQLEAQFLSNLLLENSASPLLLALETTDLGSAPSPLCGLEDSNKEMSFICGLEGSSAEKADEFEQLVLDTLKQVVHDGIDSEQIESVLHQLELSQREIGGDHYPFGLQLILSGLSTAIHRGDVIAHMNIDAALEQLRNNAQDPDYIKQLIQTHLLDNQHRVRLVFKPDQQLDKQRTEEEKNHLADIKARLSETEKQAIIHLSQQLEQRQNEIEDDMDDILPKVTIDDVPEQISQPECHDASLQQLKISNFNQGTNGIVYQQLILNLPPLSDIEYQYLPVFNYCFGELGYADKDYLQTQVEQSLLSGGIYAQSTLRGEVDNEQQVRGYYTISGKSLLRNHKKMSVLLNNIFLNMRFDESERIKELISQLRMRKENSITGSGHSLAMQAAISRMSPVAYLNQKNKGLQSIAFIKQLDSSLNNDPQAMQNLQDIFSSIHQKLLNSESQFLLVCEEESFIQCRNDILDSWKSNTMIRQTHPSSLNLESIKQNVSQAWLTTTQVNFCAKAYATVTVEHKDSAALTVLGGFLRNGFLHRNIREQGGAYGGGASQDSTNACFKFFSYRDPRLSETINDFDQSIQWLLNTQHEYLALEEAILGVISSLDKPASPAGDAKQVFHNNLFGRSIEQRQQFRKRILEVTIDDLIAVANTYFIGQSASIAIITNHDHKDECCELGLEIFNLN